MITLLAVAGKIVSAAVFARVLGHGWRPSAGSGLMMNCRGVTELVVLQIGLSLGVLSPRLSTMLARMALITTPAAAASPGDRVSREEWLIAG
ncbi:cation:proton antiporter [Saccharopolyspora sp. TS4A08]|uniref:Cation:proton antiporter n=1 Tax=Saccharopolyspora ipomoeae TaxID=3042027 RepID=A0ABT6PQI3_9PSEU|nr:cation:proton antiporter [Saccharopolyspora sp. TS4A08]MDI2030245.1 cation:proton antiporter [Saccharopolyspora sp. TS4A08]